ncbi:putative short chain dehydrogenase reductase family [Lipomyces orientalis]|uniref:Short chain dehydrogenase reductase family n=1 Tax=Lipomyces orientalis TaxID=1233043 RepID=A0ACC3TLR9_9ASCO
MPLYQPPNVHAPTGGARGIAETGADVALIYLSSIDAERTAAKIAAQTGVRVKAYHSDVSKRNIIAETISIVVANSEVCANVPSLEYTEETRNNSVNYDGVMWTAQAAGKIFEKQGKGNRYGVTVEWAHFARVNCISFGFILTIMLTGQPKELMAQWLAMIPGRRICDSAESKGAYVFLASDACCYMTGAHLVIDAGYNLP